MTRLESGLADILKKSSRLMAEKGYDGTSMRALAMATRRSLAGLYHYFQNKEELLYLINQSGFSTLFENACRIDAEDWASDQKLYAFIENHVSYFSTHIDEMRVMMLGTQSLDSRRGREIKKLKDDYRKLGQKIITDLICSRANRQPSNSGTEAEITRKTFLLFGMMNWVAGWYFPDQHGPPEDLTRDIYETFMQGAIRLRRKRSLRGLRVRNTGLVFNSNKCFQDRKHDGVAARRGMAMDGDESKEMGHERKKPDSAL